MKRRTVILGLGATQLLWCARGLAQQTKTRRIGYLAQLPEENPVFRAFERRLQELGWVRNRNVEYVYFASSVEKRSFAEGAEEILKKGIDVIVTNNTPSTQAAVKATRTIPIVFGAAANPDKAGLIASYSHPGGNVTGLALDLEKLNSKRLEYLRDLFPNARRFGSLYQPGSVAALERDLMEKDKATASQLRVELQHIPIETASGIEAGFAVASKSRLDAVRVSSATVFVVNMKEVAAAALRHRIPAMGPDARMADEGLMASYGENLPRRFQQTAELVDKVLRGARPADLPVEYPDSLELVINLKAAKALGVSVPADVLAQAKRVIE